MSRAPGWLVAEGPLGIRWLDAGIVTVIAGVNEIEVVVGGGAGAQPLNARAYLAGALIGLPVLFRHRWPLRTLLAAFCAVFIYYMFFRRNISPAPTMALPVYDAALAGYLAWTIAIPSVVMGAGLVAVGTGSGESAFTLASNFLPSIVVFVLAVTLGEVVRTRRALAASTAERLRLAAEERATEERLRIARELHDTVAHSMATIAVQAGSALHLLKNSASAQAAVEAALTAIRETSKAALNETRTVLGQLRQTSAPPPGLDHLQALRDAIGAAGLAVTISVSGTQVPLPAEVDHAAYRIVQESLTNVLRHGGPSASATVTLDYETDCLTITIANSGEVQDGSPSSAGHGIRGMRERAAAVGGSLTAGPADGGFLVSATLPFALVAQ